MDVVCRRGSVVAVTVVRVASDRLVSVSFVLPVVCEGVLILGYIYPYVEVACVLFVRILLSRVRGCSEWVR